MVKNGQLTDQNMQLINSIQDAKDIDVLRLLKMRIREIFFKNSGSLGNRNVSKNYDGSANCGSIKITI